MRVRENRDDPSLKRDTYTDVKVNDTAETLSPQTNDVPDSKWELKNSRSCCTYTGLIST